MLLKYKILNLFLLASVIFYNGNTKASKFHSLLTSFNNHKNHALNRVYNKTINGFNIVANKFKFVPISRDSVTFFLYQPDSEIPTVLRRAYLNKIGWRTKIIYIIHGWNGDGRMEWIVDMVKAFFKSNKRYYIVVVDWSEASNQTYLKAANSAQAVGNISAEFLWRQIGKKPSRLKNVHVIGHSLGAHVAGFLGKRIYHIAKRRVGRVTGLEAASMLFEIPIPRMIDNRLYKNDADFVDCYHTDAGIAGQLTPCGKVDVYFNCGGPVQPGCGNNQTLLTYLPKGGSCSHSIAHDYFINTIIYPKIYPMLRCRTKSLDNKMLILDSKPYYWRLLKMWDLLNFWRDTNLYAGQSIKKDLDGVFCVSTKRNHTNKDEKCMLIYNELI